MSNDIEMIRVEGSVIRAGRPLPFSVFLADGTLLAAEGCRIRDSEKIAILREEGWRPLYPGESPVEACADLARISSPEEVVHPRKDRSVALERTTVLVADDISLERLMLSNILLGQGVMKVIQAEDGRKAVSRFFTDSPELVMLDLDMPSLDGLGALKRIKAWSPGTFVCLVSANGTRENVQVVQEQAVDAFIVKPYTPLNLKRVLAGYEARRP